MMTAIQMIRVHVHARWAWGPAVIPASEGRVRTPQQTGQQDYLYIDILCVRLRDLASYNKLKEPSTIIINMNLRLPHEYAHVQNDMTPHTCTCIPHTHTHEKWRKNYSIFSLLWLNVSSCNKSNILHPFSPKLI